MGDDEPTPDAAPPPPGPSPLDRLLAVLDEDRDRAGAEYRRLHERVAGLLRWWGAPDPEGLADETLDRVARKVEQGTDIRDGSFGAYVRGVARLVFYESLRRAGREAALPETAHQAAPPPDHEAEAALACLDRCLATLGPDERRLVLRYYEGEGRSAEVRRRLAEDLGISATALRIRTHRLRERLERCVSGCLAGG